MLAVTEDMKNLVEYKVMGTVKKVITKENCEPRKFWCQADREKRKQFGRYSSNTKCGDKKGESRSHNKALILHYHSPAIVATNKWNHYK